MSNVRYIGCKEEELGKVLTPYNPIVSFANLGTRVVDDKVEANLPMTYERRNEHNGRYSTLQHRDFGSIIRETYNIPLPEAKDEEELKKKLKELKGTKGMIFPYVDPQKVMHSKEDMINRGVKTGGVVFVDLDHHEELEKQRELDQIVAHFEEFVKEMPDLLATVYSSSGKGLHMYFLTEELEGHEYAQSVAEHYVALYDVLKRVIGEEKAEKMLHTAGVFDPSAVSLSQRQFISYSKVVCWNPRPEIHSYFSLEELKGRLNEKGWNKFKEKEKYFQKFTPLSKEKREKKIAEDKNTYVGHSNSSSEKVEGYIEHEDRIKLFSGLLSIFPTRERAIEEYRRCAYRMEEGNDHDTNFFVEMREMDGIKAVMSEKIRKLLNRFGYSIDYKIEEGYNDSSTLPDIDDVCQQYRVVDVRMNKDEYLYNYVDTFDKNSTKFNYIAAGTGTGKTEFVKSIQKTRVADLCYPMTSTRDGKGGENIITTRDVSTMEKAVEKWNSKESLTMIVDTCVSMIEKLPEGAPKRPCVFVDESHMAISEMNYRKVMSGVLFNLTSYYDKVFFMSGTTWKEYDFVVKEGDVSSSDVTIFNCTKPQKIRSLMDWYDYTPIREDRVKKEESVEEEKNNDNDSSDDKKKKKLQFLSFSPHLRQLVWDNRRHGVVTVIFANQYNAMIQNMLDNMRVKYGKYDRPSKQGATVKNVNEKNATGELDVVLATRYMSVGVELKDNRTYCFVFLERDVTAQEIQQVKERDRLGKNRIVVYRDNSVKEEKKSWDDTVEGINNMLKLVNSDKYVRSIIEGITKLPFITVNEREDKLEFDERIWRVCKFADEKRKEWSCRDYIKDYFEKKGVLVREPVVLEDKELGYSNSKKRDNKVDGEYLVNHFDEVMSFYEALGEFDTSVDYFVEYDREGKIDPGIYDGKYYFNNTRYVVECLRLMNILSKEDVERVRKYVEENKVIIDVNRLREYNVILKIVSYQKEMRIVLKHFIKSFKNIKDLEDQKEVKRMKKAEIDYFFESKKIQLDDLEESVDRRVKEAVKKLIGGFWRFFYKHPDMVSEVEEMLEKNDDWYNMISDTIVCDIFDELYNDHRTNEHLKKKITVDGVEYDSIVDVCKVMEWSENGLQVMMNRNKYKSQFKYKGHIIDR